MLTIQFNVHVLCNFFYSFHSDKSISLYNAIVSGKSKCSFNKLYVSSYDYFIITQFFTPGYIAEKITCISLIAFIQF
jgi:hypothetical protein